MLKSKEVNLMTHLIYAERLRKYENELMEMCALVSKEFPKTHVLTRKVWDARESVMQLRSELDNEMHRSHHEEAFGVYFDR